ncbi:MAG: hypothetical protein Q9171_000259 [Xanthocarpia ochracea]
MGSPDMTPYRLSSAGVVDNFFGAHYSAAPLNDFDSLEAEQAYPDALLLAQGYGPTMQTAIPGANNSHSSESSPGSSSNSSLQHQRQMSSNSSRSATYETDAFVSNQAQLHDSKVRSSSTNGGFAQRAAEASVTDHELNRQMDELFDFDSAANSPGKSVATEISSEKPILGMAIPQYQRSPQRTEGNIIQSHNRVGPLASRSVVSTPSSFKPESLWQHHLPQDQPFACRGTPAFENNCLYNQPYGTTAAPSLIANAGFVGPNNFVFPPPMSIPTAATIPGSDHFEQTLGPKLTIEPISSKTRVETQIPIKLTLDPLPWAITKIHLPTRTMAKSKLIAKPRPSPSPEMLELDVMPVCASAMRKPGVRERAFALARGEGLSTQPNQQSPQSSSKGLYNDVDLNGKIQPMDGGPISICDGCVMRERKRASRRIEKEETAEDIMWKQGEKDRIVVFNESEVMEWKPYGSADLKEPVGKRGKASGKGKKKGESGEDVHTPTFTPGAGMPYRERAKQVRLQMRITCYCRHQGEPEGFQVIFTLKDHLGNCVAQNLSSPILITDDHKTSTLQNESANPESTDRSHICNGGFFPAGPSGNVVTTPHLFNPGHSRSATDLFSHPYHHNHAALQRPSTSASLHQLGHMSAVRSADVSTPSKHSSYRTSANLTPRNLSRQVSLSATSGPTPKRRKASGSMSFHRPLVDLSMTRMEAADTACDQKHHPSLSPSSSSDVSEGLTMAPVAPATPAARISPHPPPISSVSGAQDVAPAMDTSMVPAVAASITSGAAPSPRSASPPADLEPMADVSASRRSGTQSPQPVQPFPNTDMTAHAQALHHSLLHLPGAFTPPSVVPRVLHTFPSEGPTSGGIQVCIVGEGFFKGLEVLFADAVATNTIVHNSSNIFCTIPPSFQAGPVHVTLRGRLPGEQPVLFNYIDLDEHNLLRLALTLLHHRNTGRIARTSDVARTMLHVNGNQGFSNGTQHHQFSLDAIDSELSILGLIDLIDQADTFVAPLYNLCQSNGQTMLHLSASLGYHRLVAGLLARGANPDVRDQNGMSAMHMACFRGRTNVVRKLLSAGGDPTIRSLLGLAPIDMATTHEVYQVISSIERHTRSRSLGATPVSHLSRSSSPASIRCARATRSGESIRVGDVDLAFNNALIEAYRSRPETPAQVWARSRRNSATDQQDFLLDRNAAHTVSNTHMVTAAAAMAAWRDNLAGQIQYFQQSVQRTLPNLQVPNLPPLPTFEACQEHPVVRRISSLVPRMNAAPAPPSYDEIYPGPLSADMKTASQARAIGDALIDNKCAVAFDASTADQPALMRAMNEASTKEQHEQLRLAHARNVKKLSNDRKLFFIWIPLLIFVVVAMTKDWAPQVVRGVGEVVGFIQKRLAA